jgi:hypothetical protein
MLMKVKNQQTSGGHHLSIWPKKYGVGQRQHMCNGQWHPISWESLDYNGSMIHLIKHRLMG